MKNSDEIVNILLERRESHKEMQKIKRKRITKIVSFTSCFCLVALLGVGVWQNGLLDKKPQISNNDIINNSDNIPQEPKIISNFSTNIEASYADPKNGEYFCVIEVDEARKKYSNQNVSFLLTIDLFSTNENGEQTRDISESEKQNEYQRLSNAGYDFYEVSYWTYEGADAQKVSYSAVVVKMSEKQLQNFKPSDKYGYMFRFVTNGDGSGVEFNENSIITKFDTSFK